MASGFVVLKRRRNSLLFPVPADKFHVFELTGNYMQEIEITE
jgi:hypothetical protein